MSTSTMAVRPSSATSSTGEGGKQEATANPTDLSSRRLWHMRQACRCGAKTRAGTPCQSPAVRGKIRCRMHGGAKGSGAPRGERNGAYRHGFHTAEAKHVRTLAADLLRACREVT
ncbi:HGGxSTG domain-containing protein [Terrihabitans rhizophilus]|uniref:HGGxSTG domain-containing protein n=1 Tax=Terrihabitans rhizophilus TaxID=3092662 RepID=A0ABU4RSN5_9HYPH|nr:HGGxSTG domain-containing protein [Terrihabitans sp. PJ23]MDX6807168.1 HGGxSTG domain-containing protein [Terrihabitans sp. PJ23]